ncbi:MAG: hypothetical protein V3T05_09135 [Myxococcota bacterium]
MGWWSRLVGAHQEPKLSDEENLLIISDVHLGEDILIGGPEHLSDYIRTLNRELAQFVAAHRALTVDDRRWHLVINGDLFDFIKVSLRPEPLEAYAEWSQHQEIDPTVVPTMPNTPENVVWKLERILEIHRPLFKELAAFLLDGNRITIIEGNHDAEFYFPEVRKTLRDSLVRLAEQRHAREKRDGEFDAEAIGSAVRFRIWFEASPGRYHIEHGHQHDEYCSFEYQMAPFDRQGSNVLATPMTHTALPYFAELLGDFSTHGLEKPGGLLRELRKVLLLPPRVIWAVCRAYVLVIFEWIRRAGAGRRAELEALRERHRGALKALANDSPYGTSTLEKLDRMTATPAEFSLYKMIRAAYVDRFLLAGVMALALLPALFMTFWNGVGLILGVTAVGMFVQWVMARSRRTLLPEDLRRAASRIAEQTGARYVVFGHSHHAELVNLRERFGIGRFGESAFYLNSGSWVTREILLGEKGHGMTYVEITGRGAALKRWLGGGQEPALLASTDGEVQLEVAGTPAAVADGEDDRTSA